MHGWQWRMPEQTPLDERGVCGSRVSKALQGLATTALLNHITVSWRRPRFPSNIQAAWNTVRRVTFLIDGEANAGTVCASLQQKGAMGAMKGCKTWEFHQTDPQVRLGGPSWACIENLLRAHQVETLILRDLRVTRANVDRYNRIVDALIPRLRGVALHGVQFERSHEWTMPWSVPEHRLTSIVITRDHWREGEVTNFTVPRIPRSRKHLASVQDLTVHFRGLGAFPPPRQSGREGDERATLDRLVVTFDANTKNDTIHNTRLHQRFPSARTVIVRVTDVQTGDSTAWLQRTLCLAEFVHLAHSSLAYTIVVQPGPADNQQHATSLLWSVAEPIALLYLGGKVPGLDPSRILITVDMQALPSVGHASGPIELQPHNVDFSVDDREVQAQDTVLAWARNNQLQYKAPGSSTSTPVTACSELVRDTVRRARADMLCLAASRKKRRLIQPQAK